MNRWRFVWQWIIPLVMFGAACIISFPSTFSCICFNVTLACFMCLSVEVVLELRRKKS